MEMTTAAPRMQPKKVPSMKRLGLLPILWVKPHAFGNRYWLVVIRRGAGRAPRR